MITDSGIIVRTEKPGIGAAHLRLLCVRFYFCFLLFNSLFEKKSKFLDNLHDLLIAYWWAGSFFHGILKRKVKFITEVIPQAYCKMVKGKDHKIFADVFS